MKKLNINLLPGDGIGIEVINESILAIKKIEELHGGVIFNLKHLDWGGKYYLEHGMMMSPDGLKILSDCDAILLGAIGSPKVPDHIAIHGLLMPIRQGMEQYINMRPIKYLDGLDSPLKNARPDNIDFMVIRENSEGEYCGFGSLRNEGTPEEMAVQESRFSRKGTSRVIRYAFEYAREHNLNNVISATKSNVLHYSMVFWDKIFKEVAASYPDIESRSMYIDALAGMFILNPQKLKVVVSSNLFGDILTDLGSAMLGSIGISPSANINPERKFPSMFEPIHGSAPDIAGKGIANPLGALWSMVMMLQHLNLPDMADILLKSITSVVADRKVRTPDMGGKNSTREVVQEICKRLDDTNR